MCRSLPGKSVLGLGLLLAVCLALPVAADVRLPAMFSEHMVLQRDVPVTVWGWAEVDEQVTVTIAGQTEKTAADNSGNWSVKLDPLAAGGPCELTVSGNNRLSIGDVLVGEVWLCSGQSNMAMTVARSNNADEELAAADYSGIRMLTVERVTAVKPQSECQGEWQVCSPETVGQFSATAYFFGRTLHKELDVPVGLINSSWGGTAVEAWTNLTVQQGVPEIAPVLKVWEDNIASFDSAKVAATFDEQLAAWQEAVKKAKAAGRNVPRRPRQPSDPSTSQNRPGNLYNSMIAPLVPYALRGAIWYQGERNAKDELSRLYGTQLQTMITNWRDEWGQGDFPFLYVQLPNFKAPQTEPSENTGWVMVREGMLKTLSLAGTGMAVTVDIGEAGNIHPKNKQDVGRRLALWALADTYGQNVVGSGPIYKSMRRQGGKIVLEFDHLGGGLVTTDGNPPRGFAIAGANRSFVWADAAIEGDTVAVSSPNVSKPVVVRYAWANNPDCNLANRAGLLASPFRTDDTVEPVVDSP